MIIKRKYVRLKVLEQVDKDFKDIFMTALNNTFKDMDDIEKERIYNYNVNEWNGCLNDFDLGNGVGGGIAYLREKFDELDKNIPYDNGFSYDDVNKVNINDKNENYIELYLCNEFDGEENIIKVIKIEG